MGCVCNLRIPDVRDGFTRWGTAHARPVGARITEPVFFGRGNFLRRVCARIERFLLGRGGDGFHSSETGAIAAAARFPASRVAARGSLSGVSARHPGQDDEQGQDERNDDEQADQTASHKISLAFGGSSRRPTLILCLTFVYCPDSRHPLSVG